MSRVRLTIAGVWCTVFSTIFASGAPDQDSSVICGYGGWSSNTTQRTVACAGQAGAVGVSRNSRYTHYAGFLGGAFIRPGTTNDQGVALEASPDNDGDGLLDGDEINGAAFGGHAQTDPNRADSDNDGMSDADEAAGMYDPNDPGHALVILSMAAGSSNHLTWVGKGGGTLNTILWTDDLSAGAPSNVLHSAAFSGGAVPWFKATNEYWWVGTITSNGFFRIKTE